MRIDKEPKKVDMRVTLACRVYIISRSINSASWSSQYIFTEDNGKKTDTSMKKIS